MNGGKEALILMQWLLTESTIIVPNEHNPPEPNQVHGQWIYLCKDSQIQTHTTSKLLFNPLSTQTNHLTIQCQEKFATKTTSSALKSLFSPFPPRSQIPHLVSAIARSNTAVDLAASIWLLLSSAFLSAISKSLTKKENLLLSRHKSKVGIYQCSS